MAVPIPNAGVLWPAAANGAGIQPLSDGKRLLLRWVKDDMGNRWGDRAGNEVHYSVPYGDLPAVLTCKGGENRVVLAVRRDDGQDYNYGEYTISRLIFPRFTIRDHYTAVLSRHQDVQDVSDQGSITSSEDDVYVVDSILKHRKVGRKWEFHVCWQGPSENTWEPMSNFVEHGVINHELKKYCKQHKLRSALRAAKREAEEEG